MADDKKRLPSARDTRMREGLAAYYVEGSARKAADATGIPYRTIASWASSEAGKEILEELRKSSGDEEFGNECMRVARKILTKIEKAVEDGGINGANLPIAMGILFDKAHKVRGKAGTTDDGRFEVTVKFGGVRKERGDSTLEAAVVQIEGQVVDS